MAKLTQTQLDHLMNLQWELYKQQDAYKVGPECQPTMDAAQKVMRGLATDAAPTTPDQFADLKWRLANKGSWAAYAPAFFSEINELIAAAPEQKAAIQAAAGYYGPGGYGNVHGRREGSDFYYVDILTQVWMPDVGGAADDMILNQPGNPSHVPPPVITIP